MDALRHIGIATTFIVAISIPSIGSAQEVLATCGASSGYIYIEDDGWNEDQISTGTITAMRMADGNYDLVIKSVGGSFSAKGDGAVVALVWGDPGEGSFGLIAIYPQQVVEIYGFGVDSYGIGEVIWSGVRDSPILGRTGKAMRAKCD
jgi:hypothetical protein